MRNYVMKKNRKPYIPAIESVDSFEPTEALKSTPSSKKYNRAKYNASTISSEVTTFGTTVYKVTFYHDDQVIHTVRYKSPEKAHEVARLWVEPEIMEDAH